LAHRAESSDLIVLTVSHITNTLCGRALVSSLGRSFVALALVHARMCLCVESEMERARFLPPSLTPKRPPSALRLEHGTKSNCMSITIGASRSLMGASLLYIYIALLLDTTAYRCICNEYENVYSIRVIHTLSRYVCIMRCNRVHLDSSMIIWTHI